MAMNRFLVRPLARGSRIVMANFPCHQGMTREEALNLAAWLVAVAEGIGGEGDPPATERFQELLREAEGS